jgi:hypothetical protein
MKCCSTSSKLIQRVLNQIQLSRVPHINDTDLMLTIVEAEVLRNKIKFVSKMMKFNKTLREENEALVKLKGMCPDNKIPKGLLTEGGEAIATCTLTPALSCLNIECSHGNVQEVQGGRSYQ